LYLSISIESFFNKVSAATTRAVSKGDCAAMPDVKREKIKTDARNRFKQKIYVQKY
jgi:hypothetical protein